MRVTKRTELIERVIVHYDKLDRVKIFNHYHSNGFRAVYCGPKRIKGLQCSSTRFTVTFERCILKKN